MSVHHTHRSEVASLSGSPIPCRLYGQQQWLLSTRKRSGSSSGRAGSPCRVGRSAAARFWELRTAPTPPWSCQTHQRGRRQAEMSVNECRYKGRWNRVQRLWGKSMWSYNMLEKKCRTWPLNMVARKESGKGGQLFLQDFQKIIFFFWYVEKKVFLFKCFNIIKH